MNTDNGSKLNLLLQSVPKDTVLLSSWLVRNGYSSDLQKVYRKSNWLESIGSGAMIRKGDHVSYEGAVYALQKQANLSVHPGGRTAFSLLGKAHYLELAPKSATLFGQPGELLPAWFKKYNWAININFYSTSFLPPDIGFTEYDARHFSLKISGAERAMMECLYLVPGKQVLYECHELMEGLSTLRPNIVQQLLESCNSVKVKRLFLYLAEKADHSWFKYIKKANIDLGSGNRSINPGGVYIPEYKIIVDKALETQQ